MSLLGGAGQLAPQQNLPEDNSPHLEDNSPQTDNSAVRVHIRIRNRCYVCVQCVQVYAYVRVSHVYECHMSNFRNMQAKRNLVLSMWGELPYECGASFMWGDLS